MDNDAEHYISDHRTQNARRKAERAVLWYGLTNGCRLFIITNINKHIRSYVYVPRIRNQPAESAREGNEIEAKTAKKGRIKDGKEKKERNRRTPKG